MMLSVLMAFNMVNVLIDRQAAAQVATKTLLRIKKFWPYMAGQNAAAMKQTVYTSR